MNARLRTWVLVGCLATLAAGGLAATSEDHSAASKQRKSDFDTHPPSKEAGRLSLFVGLWEVKQTTFNDKGEATAVLEGSEEVVWILDKHAVRRMVAVNMGDKALESEGVFSYNDTTDAYDGVWFSNWSTSGPMDCSAKYDPESRTFEMRLKARATGPNVREYRVVERFINKQRRITTTYEIRPEGEVKVLEVVSQSAAKCPAGPRPIYDDGLFG